MRSDIGTPAHFCTSVGVYKWGCSGVCECNRSETRGRYVHDSLERLERKIILVQKRSSGVLHNREAFDVSRVVWRKGLRDHGSVGSRQCDET